jgi:hypothetical protein
MPTPTLIVYAGSALVKQVPLESIKGYSWNEHSDLGQGEKFAFTVDAGNSDNSTYFFFSNSQASKQAYDRLAEALRTQTNMRLDLDSSLNEHMLR